MEIDVSNYKKLNLSPGDILTVNVDLTKYPRSKCEDFLSSLRYSLKVLFPVNKVIIHDKNIDFSVSK